MNHFLEKALGFDRTTMQLKTEVVAGLTTFLTMSYILAVNPAILSTTGMDRAALFTGTALAAAIATMLLAFMAKLPFAQAPSMGLNAFFAFTMCQAMGYTWEQALAIMLIEGIVFILITFFNVRELIMESIPKNIRFAISVGIGMFIAFIGLKNAGIIVAKSSTFVGLGAFTPMSLLGIFAILLSGNHDGPGYQGSSLLCHYSDYFGWYSNGCNPNPHKLAARFYATKHQSRVLPLRLQRLFHHQDIARNL